MTLFDLRLFKTETDFFFEGPGFLNITNIFSSSSTPPIFKNQGGDFKISVQFLKILVGLFSVYVTFLMTKVIFWSRSRRFFTVDGTF